MPAQAPWLHNWDVLTMASLCFTAVMAPFEVAFLTTQLDTLFILNRFIDLVFIVVRAVRVKVGGWCCASLRSGGGVCVCKSELCVGVQDLVLNLLTARFDEENGLWAYKFKSMMRLYLRGWFAVDFVRARVGCWGRLGCRRRARTLQWVSCQDLGLNVQRNVVCHAPTCCTPPLHAVLALPLHKTIHRCRFCRLTWSGT